MYIVRMWILEMGTIGIVTRVSRLLRMAQDPALCDSLVPLTQGRSGGALDIVYKSITCWGIVTRDP